MWLLNTTTYQLHFVQDPAQEAYAILSHVWDRTGEQTFQDVQNIHATARSSFPIVPADNDPELLEAIRSRLSEKIRRCCDYARARGLPYAWIDACCIDKTSSAELSEAINSMFDWYAHAEVCYVFLADVSAADDPHAPGARFRWSAWFSRGWTLQELLVPWGAVFLSREWRMLGTKASLARVIESVTGIERDVLLRVRPLHTVSVARRMAWAAGRQTTRVEDEAYCLMGIFGVRLPVIYGEGTQAFIRLQEEIMKRIPDQSLFSWGLMLPLGTDSPDTPLPAVRRVPAGKLRASKGAYLLASCPGDFRYSGGFASIPLDALGKRLGMASPAPALCLSTGHGVRITLPVHTMHFPSKEGPVEVQLAILACEDSAGRIPALIVSSHDASGAHFTSGFDGEGGFLTNFEGVVQLLPSGTELSRRERYPSCLRSISRSEWIRAARASAFPYSPQYPRLALLAPSMFDTSVRTPISELRVRELCIPCQRLQAGAGGAIYGRRPEWMDAGFTGECEIVFPPWTLQNLGALGVVLEGLPTYRGHRRGEDLVLAAQLGWYTSHQSFRLVHAASNTTVVVTVYSCPEGELDGPLHASVKWEGDATACLPEEEILDGKPSQCDGQHVSLWGDGTKRFAGPTEAYCSAVTLQFSIWDADEMSGVGLGSEDCGCYALDVKPEFPLAADSIAS